jgi:hypothetical protein
LNGKRFEAVPANPNSGLAVVTSGRGVALGDLFNDGKVDVVINNLDGPPTLLRNVVGNGNHWIDLKLVGGTGSPRDAIGAKVFVTAGGITQRNDVISGGSYCSSNDLRLHFGLGKVSRVDKLEIRWPSGKTQAVEIDALDRIYTIEEGKGVVKDQIKDQK